MAWARLDDTFYDHPKVLPLTRDQEGLAALGLWTLAVSWANKTPAGNGHAGHVPADRIRHLAGKRAEKLADRLQAAGLFDPPPSGADGYRIHDFEKYARDRSKTASRAAQARWSNRAADDA